jgi:hypothetical protein
LEGNFPKVQLVVNLVCIFCLISPCDKNGSDLIHDKILLPIHKLIQIVANNCWSTFQSIFKLKTDKPGYTDTFSQFFISLGSALNLDVGKILFQSLDNLGVNNRNESPRLFSNLLKEILYGRKVVKRRLFSDMFGNSKRSLL